MLIPDLAWIVATAEDTGGSPDIGKILNQFGQYGIVGLAVILLIVGVMVPKYVMNNLMAEKDSWRQAFENERDAHQLTHEQLAKAEERGDVAIEQGKTVTRLLEELGHYPELPRSA
ncbi:hypothetical protein F9278_04440 [Streptomyces phaeolivaceus]|uniref:Uncharacterized protein n=1 Tax=Streptomyces phaeolivaceus TaxID=2653200 RepID=A0A5P8JYR5_9ACTN|nr:hypothetical protein [Streptomyces phaeolivaceus]QFQ95559.1 hypothetical protein F9278_04440 [Streptomyces phaeolivaceus]